MKNIFRTVMGKTTLFILLNLLVLILVGCVSVAYFSIEDYYNRSEENVIEEVLAQYIQNDLYYILDSTIFNHDLKYIDIPEGMAVYIKSSKGVYIYKSANYSEFISAPDNEKFIYAIETNSYENSIHSWNVVSDNTWKNIADNTNIKHYYAYVYVAPEYYSYGEKSVVTALLHIIYKMKYAIYPIAFVSVIGWIVLFVGLMSVSGRRKGDDDNVYLSEFSSVPYDIMILLSLCVIGISGSLLDEVRGSGLFIIAVIATLFIVYNIFLGLSVSAAARIKKKVFIKNTVIFRILILLKKFFIFMLELLSRALNMLKKFARSIPIIWKCLAVIIALFIMENILLFNLGVDGQAIFLLDIERIIVSVLVIYLVIVLYKFRDAIGQIAHGDWGHKISDNNLYLVEFRECARDLNSISNGISVAVNEKMKSERMKTELITNVSHDIKTPLTSIINYVSLIQNEKSENKKICEYSQVLARQSEKLKRLIEDLVEVSKAATGNLDVIPEVCNAVTFISQVAGEYSEKIDASGLTLVTKTSDEEIRIMADSRRMWRVFDNLMNNICKYSQTGTRVYIALEKKEDKAYITFKNTSREELDISSDELIERFVRGDSSRNTEGNGLGLSIAKSLTELQNGKMELVVDGDLFKVVLVFPIIDL